VSKWPKLASLVARVLIRIYKALYEALRSLQLLSVLPRAHAVMVIKYCPHWLMPLIQKRARGRVLYDFDDPMWLESFVGEDEFRHLVRNADFVSTDNTLMLEKTQKIHSRAFVVRGPSQIEVFEASPPVKIPRRSAGTLVVGWVGSQGTLPYLDQVIPSLRALHVQGVDFIFRIVGSGRADLTDRLKGVPFETVDFYDQARMVSEVQNLDIGLFPLFSDDELSVFRGTLKARIYMSGGVPVIASDIGLMREIIRDGENGLLVSGADEWEEKIKMLALDSQLRTKMGEAGRKTVSENYRLRHSFEDLKKGFFDELR